MTTDVSATTASVLAEDGPAGSRAVVVFFAGLGARPYFEFHRTGLALRAHRVFLRDFSGDWYQNGLPGAGACADELAGFLREHCARLGADRLVTVGNSAGGFAAVLFGILAGADEVHAFAPKIRTLGPSDFREQSRLAHLNRTLREGSSYRDVSALLREGRGGRTAVHVHYADGDAMDAAQAQLLEGLPGVRLWRYPWPHHGVVRPLGRSGVIRRLIENAVDGDPRRVGGIVARGRWLLRVRALAAAFARPRARPAETD